MDEPVDRADASVLNRELTTLLVEMGERMGFSSATEWPVSGGRLDVVWTWMPPTPLPGVQGALPVVAFEVESSWRTRKHVKGDLLNLQDAGVALGVIVLAGADERDESLRRFAQNLVDRPGTRVLVWTHDDVRALAAGEGGPTAIAAAAIAVANPPAPTARVAASTAAGATEHHGRYRPLWVWLRQADRNDLRVTFADVERILGFPVPQSCRDHVAHWQSYDGSAVARAIIDAGWHAHHVDLVQATVALSPGPPPRR